MAKKKRKVTPRESCEFWELTAGDQYYVDREFFRNGEFVMNLTRCDNNMQRFDIPSIFFDNCG